MPHPSKSQPAARQGSNARTAVMLIIAVSAGLVIAAAAALASTQPSRPTVALTQNARLHASVLVDSRGRTLYALSPETTRHLLCKPGPCFPFWPPLHAASAKTKLIKAVGVKGKLALMQRQGFVQVTLNGRPLYHFSGDSTKGQANGDGIHSFGGVWHAVRASGAGQGHTTTTTSMKTTSTPTTTTTTTTSTPTTTTTSTSSTYSYPMY